MVSPTLSGLFKSSEPYCKWALQKRRVLPSSGIDKAVQFSATAFFIGKHGTGKIKPLFHGHEIYTRLA